jgi:hypothetical protein
MARYLTRPKAYVVHTADGVSFMPHLEVDGPRYTFTGLLDPTGQELWRLPEPIGFHWD